MCLTEHCSSIIMMNVSIYPNYPNLTYIHLTNGESLYCVYWAWVLLEAEKLRDSYPSAEKLLRKYPQTPITFIQSSLDSRISPPSCRYPGYTSGPYTSLKMAASIPGVGLCTTYSTKAITQCMVYRRTAALC